LVNAADAAALSPPYGTITRGSRLLQVTYQGKPLYTYYLDHAEGDDLGDGVGSVWHDIDFE
jgi:predicted lipoprotein with Yx(FWY)xxD motif